MSQDLYSDDDNHGADENTMRHFHTQAEESQSSDLLNGTQIDDDEEEEQEQAQAEDLPRSRAQPHQQQLDQQHATSTSSAMMSAGIPGREAAAAAAAPAIAVPIAPAPAAAATTPIATHLMLSSHPTPTFPRVPISLATLVGVSSLSTSTAPVVQPAHASMPAPLVLAAPSSAVPAATAAAGLATSGRTASTTTMATAAANTAVDAITAPKATTTATAVSVTAEAPRAAAAAGVVATAESRPGPDAHRESINLVDDESVLLAGEAEAAEEAVAGAWHTRRSKETSLLTGGGGGGGSGGGAAAAAAYTGQKRRAGEEASGASPSKKGNHAPGSSAAAASSSSAVMASSSSCAVVSSRHVPIDSNSFTIQALEERNHPLAVYAIQDRIKVVHAILGAIAALATSTSTSIVSHPTASTSSAAATNLRTPMSICAFIYADLARMGRLRPSALLLGLRGERLRFEVKMHFDSLGAALATFIQALGQYYNSDTDTWI